jgi:polyhydroxyalkanoate synthesis regulator phasin
MVERGEIAEQEGKKLYTELMEKRKKKTAEAQDAAGNQMRDMLDRMDVPTKADIDVLSEKITALSKKVDELKKAQG